MNKTLAIHVAVPAIPPNPNKAAMIAIIKKTIAQLNWPFLEIIIIHSQQRTIYRRGVIFCTTIQYL